MTLVSVVSVEELRVRCPSWCVADHHHEAPGGWLPPNGDAVLHASAPFAEVTDPPPAPASLPAGVPVGVPDVLRVTVAQRQVHPDRDGGQGGDGATELLIAGSVALSTRADIHRLITALQTAQALLAP